MKSSFSLCCLVSFFVITSCLYSDDVSDIAKSVYSMFQKNFASANASSIKYLMETRDSVSYYNLQLQLNIHQGEYEKADSILHQLEGILGFDNNGECWHKLRIAEGLNDSVSIRYYTSLIDTIEVSSLLTLFAKFDYFLRYRKLVKLEFLLNDEMSKKNDKDLILWMARLKMNQGLYRESIRYLEKYESEIPEAINILPCVSLFYAINYQKLGNEVKSHLYYKLYLSLRTDTLPLIWMATDLFKVTDFEEQYIEKLE